MKKIILASTSPRRKEILSKTRLPFEVVASDYEEDMSLPMSPGELVEYLSCGKAEAVATHHPDAIIIAADTFVVHDGCVIGKPKNAARAAQLLQILQGTAHQIMTGVTILDSTTGKTVTFHDTINVHIKKMSDETIARYIATGEPLDKAGAYAIQELGAIFVEKTEGDFFTAMGLPLSRLSDELRGFGVEIC